MANILGGSLLGSVVALTVLTGCGDRPSWETTDDGAISTPSPGVSSFNVGTLFEGEMKRAPAKVAPIAGGTLTITRTGVAVAADPDRDAVHVVELSSQKVLTVPLQEGDEPGRVVEGPLGTAYVAARRGGVIAAVDLVKGTARRIPVCAAPRGLAYDGERSRLYVACRSGLLAELDTKTEQITRRTQLDPDLRDVVLSGDSLVISRFKTAEILLTSREGQVLRRSITTGRTTRGGVAAVAYRTLALPTGGGVLVGHVEATNTTLPSGAGQYYGAPCGGSVADLTLTAVSTSFTAGTDARTGSALTLASHTLGGVAGPLDIAFSPDGQRTAVVGTGNSWSPNRAALNNLFVTATAQVSQNGTVFPCPTTLASSNPTTSARNVGGEPVAVAFDLNNTWVVQSRQPAMLLLENGGAIPLATDDRFDTGLAMFHMNAGGGVSCTSCHPEAGEDGHTWNFSIGPRRSQALEGGASTRSPFHWEGDLGTFDKLFQEVMMKRMSLAAKVTPKQRAALRDWIDTVPLAPSADALDDEAVARGKVLFEDRDLACSSCHGGSDFTDNLPHDVGTGLTLITPSLRGVGTREPLFHDGCAVRLEDRFGPCGGGDAHGITSGLTKAQQSDLVAFMRSL